MQISLMKRVVFGFCFAVPLVLLTVVVSQARSPQQEEVLPTECQSCHAGVVANWENSAHGLAATEPAFTQAWQEQGSPPECLSCHATGYAPSTDDDPSTATWSSEGIACSTCHVTGPNSTSHPEQIMSIDASSEACGACHVDTHIEWQTSQHGARQMTCVKCHNPHTTKLKAENVQALCRTCHNEEGHFYSFTAHAQQGLLCTDCHLSLSNSAPGEGHGQRIHTFGVDLNTCTQCHDQEMHSPMQNPPAANNIIGGSSPAATSTDSADMARPEPAPASPFGFALLAAVIGLAFGVIGSPWIERRYRRSGLTMSEVTR
jgi:predicted CXXCH cytochrome family protein